MTEYQTMKEQRINTAICTMCYIYFNLREILNFNSQIPSRRKRAVFLLNCFFKYSIFFKFQVARKAFKFLEFYRGL